MKSHHPDRSQGMEGLRKKSHSVLSFAKGVVVGKIKPFLLYVRSSPGTLLLLPPPCLPFLYEFHTLLPSSLPKQGRSGKCEYFNLQLQHRELLGQLRLLGKEGNEQNRELTIGNAIGFYYYHVLHCIVFIIIFTFDHFFTCSILSLQNYPPPPPPPPAPPHQSIMRTMIYLQHFLLFLKEEKISCFFSPQYLK